MSIQNDIDAVEIWVLSGGLGTRLATVWAGKPKILVPIGGRPYLDWLLSALKKEGFKRFKMLLGMGSERVVEHLKAYSGEIQVEWTIEDSPLGTGGALANGMKGSDALRFFLVNGDSYCGINYRNMLEQHRSGDFPCTMGLARVPDIRDFGSVQLGSGNNIVRFQEKASKPEGGYVNAGVYILERSCCEFFPNKDVFSLERDVLPKMAEAGALGGFKAHGELIDIGTPARLELAQAKLVDMIESNHRARAE